MKQQHSPLAIWSLLVLILGLSGCASSRAPLPTPEQVDLQRFMGPWFVHGYTPIVVDKNAHNAVEQYTLDAKGRVQTTYQFRKGGVDGKLKTYRPTGYPRKDDASNARWKMQFIWPFKADYVIVHLSDDYQQTIVAHPNRKYAWIMARSTRLSESDYQALLQILQRNQFDPKTILRVPHDWSQDSERLQKNPSPRRQRATLNTSQQHTTNVEADTPPLGSVHQRSRTSTFNVQRSMFNVRPPRPSASQKKTSCEDSVPSVCSVVRSKRRY